MLMATLFYAVMNILVKYLDHIPSHQIVFIRSVVSCLICLVLLLRAKIPIWGNNKALLIARGLAGSGGLLCFFYTLHHMPLASAVTIQYLSPVFTAILAVFLLKERLIPIQILLFLIAFTGAIMVKGFDVRISWKVLYIGIAAAVLSATAYNLVRKLRSSDHPLVIIFYFTIVTIPLIGPYTLTNWTAPDLESWIILILIGIATQFAQWFMTKAYHSDTAAYTSMFSYSGIIFGLFFGMILFNEFLEPFSLVGVLLVFVALLMNFFVKNWRRLKKSGEV